MKQAKEVVAAPSSAPAQPASSKPKKKQELRGGLDWKWQ
jgi:hypothetical protein